MPLHEFIEQLQSIANAVDDARTVPVQMADTLPVVAPLYKDGVVYISDQEEERQEH